MSFMILYMSLYLACGLLLFSMVITICRMVLGPRAQDRVLGLDTLYVNALLLLVTFSICSGERFYMEIALIIALLGFTTTVTFTKFMMRGEVIE